MVLLSSNDLVRAGSVPKVVHEDTVMGRAYKSDDMDESDDIGMESAEDDLSSFDVADMASSREDAAEARSVTSRCRMRDQLNHDIDAYLASGGAIHHAANRLQHGAPYNPGNHQGSRSH